KPAPKPAPKPASVPWPPETFRFAGKSVGDEWSGNGLGMRFCWCPPGKFVMGSPKNEKDRDFNGFSADQVAVTLTKGFWLGKFEVTQGQWERVKGTDLIQQKDIATAQFWWETKNQGYFDGWWDMNRLKWLPRRRARTEAEKDFGEGPSYPMYYVNHLEA